MPRPSRRIHRAEALLCLAGIDAAITATEPGGIGMSGLNVRGPRDEDGTHTRVHLSDGTTVVLRDFESNGVVAAFQAKEAAMFSVLRSHGLVPDSLYASYGSRPDDTAVLVYETAGRLARAKGVGRPERSRLPGPPHPSVAMLVDDIPTVVEQLRGLLP